MKLVRLATSRGPILATMVDGGAVEVATGLDGVTTLGETIGAADSLRQLPVVAPSKVIGVGLNYLDHASEAGAELPRTPLTFAKYPSAVIGDGDQIRLPREASQVDYEAELGVVIGREARDVDAGRALDYVLGYTCVNDVSARDIHLPEGQWTRGKSFDTFCPVGPHIVTSDEIPDPQSLPIKCIVDQEVRQDDTTRSMVFSVAELISFISRDTTLIPGDLICTGTPAGVAFGRDEPNWLQPGSTVTIDIGAIGSLTNQVTEARTGGH